MKDKIVMVTINSPLSSKERLRAQANDISDSEKRKVVMAEGVVSFGVQKLWELLSQESERLRGVDKQVDELRRELGRLESLLKDADAKKHDSERVRNFLEDIKDIVYDAEDIIEIFLLRELRGKEKGIKKHVRRLAVLVDRRKFASDIEDMTKRISGVIGRMQSLGIQQIIDGGSSMYLQERQKEQREIRQTFPNSSESDLLGVEQSVEELVGYLVGNDNIQVVSVSGMGGIGKTTLARQVFHHDMVRHHHFDGFAWVCVSQQFTQKHVWKRIFQDLRPQDGDISHMDEYTLQGKLFRLLEAGRYLIVLDDVWKKKDWDRIKAVFPHNRGCKMLLTCRNEGVGLHADPTCIAFKPRILTSEESWKLCERIIFPRRDETEHSVKEELEGMGKRMVTYCGGLPLAVKVLGGLLARKHTVPEWKRVDDNIGPQIVGACGFDDNNLNSVSRVLSLSYEDLPMQLKHCFLYLAHFPEDYKINANILFNYWAAEGTIASIHNGATIRESGEYYLEELVRRNMVIAEKSYLTSRIEYCQMHDMMREVCLSKAKEENFVGVFSVSTSTSTINAEFPSRFRRLAVHSGKSLCMMGYKNNKKVRSVLFVGDEDYFRKQAAGLAPDFRGLPLLRVLDLSYVEFEGGKLPSSIGELVHLRFLRLYKAGVSHVPSSLGNLKLLMYLNLGVDGVSVRVPNVLKEMRELRFLSLPVIMHDETKLELGDLVNLETLWSFSTKHGSVTDFLRMTKLRTLNVSFSDGCTSETLLSSLRELRCLEKLSLYDFPEIRVAYQGGEIVLDFIHLKDLTLSMHTPRLPHQHRFPPHLANICLSYCSMEEDPMPILEKLLRLKSVELSYCAFLGKRMVCSNGGFPQLSVLQLYAQSELEEWIVEQGSMPCLRILTIDDCKKLKELPDGLNYIASLKELTIVGMKREWKDKLSEGGQDYYKVQHVPSVQFIYCDEE